MMERKKLTRVTQFRPKAVVLLSTIHRLALEAGLVGFSDHAVARMEERTITRLDALRILREGDLRGDIEAGRSEGEWKCKVVMKLKGSREAGVVTVVMDGKRLFVKTVEWEDT